MPNTDAKKRLPPFGRQWLAKRNAGVVPINGVWITCRFSRARAFSGWRVVVPDDLDPETLDFRFVAGLDVVCSADTLERLQALARAVLPYQPRRLTGLCRTPAKIHIFKAA